MIFEPASSPSVHCADTPPVTGSYDVRTWSRFVSGASFGEVHASTVLPDRSFR
ncbi:hypothetical protein EES43_23985 [Streptomyces sp. ADI96-02]|nr:hypothetical protein EES43_23985 [Streptomyces sp. ADI96-02]